MNQYVIGCRGKRYATNADNISEAENRFMEVFGECDDEITITQTLDIENDIEEVIFF